MQWFCLQLSAWFDTTWMGLDATEVYVSYICIFLSVEQIKFCLSHWINHIGIVHAALFLQTDCQAIFQAIWGTLLVSHTCKLWKLIMTTISSWWTCRNELIIVFHYFKFHEFSNYFLFLWPREQNSCFFKEIN